MLNKYLVVYVAALTSGQDICFTPVNSYRCAVCSTRDPTEGRCYTQLHSELPSLSDCYPNAEDCCANVAVSGDVLCENDADQFGTDQCENWIAAGGEAAGMGYHIDPSDGGHITTRGSGNSSEKALELESLGKAADAACRQTCIDLIDSGKVVDARFAVLPSACVDTTLEIANYTDSPTVIAVPKPFLGFVIGSPSLGLYRTGAINPVHCRELCTGMDECYYWVWTALDHDDPNNQKGRCLTMSRAQVFATLDVSIDTSAAAVSIPESLCDPRIVAFCRSNPEKCIPKSPTSVYCVAADRFHVSGFRTSDDGLFPLTGANTAIFPMTAEQTAEVNAVKKTQVSKKNGGGLGRNKNVVAGGGSLLAGLQEIEKAKRQGRSDESITPPPPATPLPSKRTALSSDRVSSKKFRMAAVIGCSVAGAAVIVLLGWKVISVATTPTDEDDVQENSRPVSERNLQSCGLQSVVGERLSILLEDEQATSAGVIHLDEVGRENVIRMHSVRLDDYYEGSENSSEFL